MSSVRSDVSDARWALIEPVFTDWRARRTGRGTAARVHDLREIVNAILYVDRTGIPWEYLPHDFPPYKTVYGYYAKWEADGTTRQVHDLLRDKTRQLHGPSVQPTAAVVDAQSVKTSTNVSGTSQGIDAGKKIKGRKRHVITDTLGLVLAALVTAANVHDTTGGKLLLNDLAAAHPSVTKVWADGGYQNSIFNHGARLGIDVEVVQRPRTKGFEPLPQRWVIERTFGWLMQHRRLARDDEALPERSRAMIHWAMANRMARELTGESTPTWRIETDIPLTSA
ncbi:IS5 family transposase [Streptomyces sp. DSM 41014]|uniref:IS5 family transposase n=1 Tax=Streptomyces hintoniae TaxID=3075521 RepID=A0ABU2USC0_9ACTN|nr:IS5 family transposase [Streptomyces sp. DSM 41014]MDT0475960.1 IS5 family transposase [Streptomyces sp. DSM 41014]